MAWSSTTKTPICFICPSPCNELGPTITLAAPGSWPVAVSPSQTPGYCRPCFPLALAPSLVCENDGVVLHIACPNGDPNPCASEGLAQDVHPMRRTVYEAVHN